MKSTRKPSAEERDEHVRILIAREKLRALQELLSKSEYLLDWKKGNGKARLISEQIVSVLELVEGWVQVSSGKAAPAGEDMKKIFSALEDGFISAFGSPKNTKKTHAPEEVRMMLRNMRDRLRYHRFLCEVEDVRSGRPEYDSFGKVSIAVSKEPPQITPQAIFQLSVWLRDARLELSGNLA